MSPLNPDAAPFLPTALMASASTSAPIASGSSSSTLVERGAPAIVASGGSSPALVASGGHSSALVDSGGSASALGLNATGASPSIVEYRHRLASLLDYYAAAPASDGYHGPSAYSTPSARSSDGCNEPSAYGFSAPPSDYGAARSASRTSASSSTSASAYEYYGAPSSYHGSARSGAPSSYAFCAPASYHGSARSGAPSSYAFEDYGLSLPSSCHGPARFSSRSSASTHGTREPAHGSAAATGGGRIAAADADSTTMFAGTFKFTLRPDDDDFLARSARLFAHQMPTIARVKQGDPKTEPCVHWPKGKCTWGSQCRFAHGRGELRLVDRDGKYRTRPCRYGPNCPYRHRCHFQH